MSVYETKTILYEARCQECDTKFNDDQLDYIPMYADKQQLLDSLEAYDWAISGDLCWCDECWHGEHNPRGE